MIQFGKTYDENSVSAKKDMTEAWQKRHNPAKSYNKQFGKSYDVNFAFYSQTGENDQISSKAGNLIIFE